MEDVIINGQQVSDNGTGNDIMSVFDPTPVQPESVSNGTNNVNAMAGLNNQPASSLQDWNTLGPQFQSKYDSLSAEFQKAQAEANELRDQSLLLQQLMSDKEMRIAFLKEIDPELIPEQNVDDLVGDQLKKEFGEGYIPDENEIRRGYGKGFRYTERAKELYGKLGGASSQTLKSLKEARLAEDNKAKAENEKQKNDLKTAFKWDDNQLNSFFDWGKKLTPIALAKMYNFALAQQGKSPGSITRVNGSPVSGNVIEDTVNKIFGPPRR